MNAIKKFIKKYGSQRKAAKRLGISQAAVCKWSLGENIPSIKNARIIAQETGATLESVYSGFDGEKPQEG